jgi:hypothetical protein
MATSLEKECRDLELFHKKLRDSDWQRSSPPTNEYNCIAFALGINNQRWQPEPEFGDHWPEGIPTTNSVESWIALFEKYGYVRCGDGNFEEGYAKIVIYADDEYPNHVAKLKSSGVWHSKMGNLADIHHPLDALSYGHRKFFLRQKLPGKKPSKKAQRLGRRTK